MGVVGQVVQGLVGLPDNLGFYVKGGEDPGELWAEGRGLTQALNAPSGGCSWWPMMRLEPGGGSSGQILEVLKVQLKGDFWMDWMDVGGETESKSRVTPRILACTPGKTELPVTEGVMRKGSLGMGWKHRVWG